jgi:hypothetical protein
MAAAATATVEATAPLAPAIINNSDFGLESLEFVIDKP